MSGALNALLAFGGNLFKSSSSVLVVINRASFWEVPNSKLRSIFALVAIASHPKHDTDAALSNSTVHWLGCGGLAQPGGGLHHKYLLNHLLRGILPLLRTVIPPPLPWLLSGPPPPP